MIKRIRAECYRSEEGVDWTGTLTYMNRSYSSEQHYCCILEEHQRKLEMHTGTRVRCSTSEVDLPEIEITAVL